LMINYPQKNALSLLSKIKMNENLATAETPAELFDAQATEYITIITQDIGAVNSFDQLNNTR